MLNTPENKGRHEGAEKYCAHDANEFTRKILIIWLIQISLFSAESACQVMAQTYKSYSSKNTKNKQKCS